MIVDTETAAAPGVPRGGLDQRADLNALCEMTPLDDLRQETRYVPVNPMPVGDRAPAFAPTEFSLCEIDRHRAEIEAPLAPRIQAAE